MSNPIKEKFYELMARKRAKLVRVVYKNEFGINSTVCCNMSNKKIIRECQNKGVQLIDIIPVKK